MRVDEPEARQFYIGEAANHGWTTRELERNIRSGLGTSACCIAR